MEKNANGNINLNKHKIIEKDTNIYLSKQIKYDRDIEPYKFIKIYAGVGAGKNYFVDMLIKGDEIENTDGTKVEAKSVLLVTSRRAKVNEQLNSDVVTYDPVIGAFDDMGGVWLMMQDDKYMDAIYSETITLPDLDGWGGDEIRKRSCVYSNAKVEHYLKNYNPYDPKTHLWERFDLIIVDEIHAVLADASYQSSPYYIRRLIQETLKRQTKCKVIVLTGSPEILEGYPLLEKAHLIDKRDICIKVAPKKVTFITKKESETLQEEFLKKNKKFISFYNHIDDLLELEKDYSEKVALSFSGNKKIAKLKTNRKETYEKMVSTQKYLAQNKKLPNDVIGFLSTSKNKEGINIENSDIKYMFVESHIGIDIIQMAGRVRNNIDELFVVVDSKPHHNIENKYEYLTEKRADLRTALDNQLKEKADKLGYDYSSERTEADLWRTPITEYNELTELISYIHEKFQYIRFDYFTYAYKSYIERKISKNYYLKEVKKYKEAVQSSETLIKLANEWFPDTPVEISDKVKLVKDTEAAVNDYLYGNNLVDVNAVLKKEERKTILDDLNTITGENNKSLKPLLNKYGFDLMPMTKSHKVDAKYTIVTINDKQLVA